jgi:U3 small nucleolar RNA-associated protein MPP10
MSFPSHYGLLMVIAAVMIAALQVRSDVAALALEEVAPLAVSDATLRTPGEVYAPAAKGEAKAEEELTQ